MREPEQFLSQALDDAGVDAEVFSQRNAETASEQLLVEKDIGQKKLTYRVGITDHELLFDDWDTIQKKLAIEAKHIKREFEEHLVSTFEWSDRVARVSLYDGAWAECQYCNSRVRAPKATYLTNSCELSTPVPVERDMSYALQEMSEHDKRVLELYLLGLLRRECDRDCQNSKWNPNT